MVRYAHITASLLVINIFLFLHLVSSQLPQNQATIMTRLYDMLKNNTDSSFEWNMVSKNSTPCSWNGVSCSADNSSINKLSFSWFSISSSDILPLLCEIDSLESLDLSNNHLNTIPEGFMTRCGGINRLKLLNFSRNKLVGSLPSFHGFVALEYLDLSHNLVSGNIDKQLDGLNSIKSLNLSYNHFTGPVPTNLGKSNVLEGLQLSNNGFEGGIPPQIANYGNLSLIDLSDNHLTGLIPQKFGELSKLDVLVLSSNNLTGAIPEFFLNITTLSRFAANQNKFTGNVPPGITRYLRHLDLSYNKLNGTIPEDLLSPPNLQSVDLSYNKDLEGLIPANISPSLVRLRLGGNSVTGPLPSRSFARLQNLMYLELENNTLVGRIPPELASCQKLALLNLAQNRFMGSLPAELGNLTNLQVLKLQHNNLSGEIPNEITQLHRLQGLNLSWNSLNGSIPSGISSLQNLTNLDLRANNLSGSIPISIGSMSSLLELQLGNNQIGGDIPAMPTKLQIALNLSSNIFDGPIPTTLSRLTELEVLDLSNNRFTGTVPEFLTGLPSLSQLIISNNQLSGVIPRFKPYVTVVNSGNKDLRNATSNSAPTPNPAPASQKKRKTVLIGVLIAVAAAALAAGFFALLALFIFRRFYKVHDKQLHAEEDVPQPQLVQGNMLTANGIHRSSIDFMKAMEAVADNSNIIFKTKFSTYYKAVMPSDTSYFVKKLNWSHKILQLGNHDKFGEELEVLGKLSNSNVMIPLAYVLAVDSAYLFYDFSPNGTLFDALHGSSGNSLDWASRYSIAIGVAQGLAFLHGCTSGPVLLLDLSSQSILLKSQNEPLIGDIELCKVIDPSKSTGSLSTVAGTVGYIPSEYAYTMRVTMAGNVYSFGVILLELLTGKRAVSQGIELAKLVLSNSSQKDKWDHILDFNVSRMSLAIRSQMLAVLKVALACVSASPEARPKMKSVLRMLLNSK